MGKKNANLSGLARFVTEAFATGSSISNTSSTPSTPLPRKNGTSYEATSNGALLSAPGEPSSGARRRISQVVDHGIDTASRPAKKRKVGLLGSEKEQYDATGLVPFYQHTSQVPSHLQKYFSQRERYFSRYSSGCLLDEEGWYSVTPERIADQIAERCRCDVVLDAFCGVGGNAIAFAKTCERVIALDISPVRLALARHNATIYGVADRIEFILADFFSFARSLKLLQESRSRTNHTDADAVAASEPMRKIDVVFLSPPWGGPSYLTDQPDAPNGEGKGTTGANGAQAPPDFSLSAIKPVHGKELFKIARGITRNVAYFLPRNVNLEEISALVIDERDNSEEYFPAQRQQSKSKEKVASEMVEVEEEWMGSKLKALTCYFGGLVSGQEDRFDS
ncbi:S-adenosyl-L-methionine-dependent methyltransferase [Daedalea quercina L-15889]|uniref:Trimethylguanosine synthase n=1 Tax=Daedalea quercina L-15889 TaxID=1314783 RepID=A0A165QB92_9APHY|nr:S-adenosyl-L-methionine-dependent methyltransferase [Daedalea quercina L-15889]